MRTIVFGIGLLLSCAISADAADFVLPDYASIKGIDRYATKEEYAAARADERFRLEKMTYDSDGLRVYTYVYRPAKPTKRLPAVIYNRGSFVRDEFAADLIVTFNRLGKAGFVVIAPMYRGSGGAEGRDEMGGADLDDLMNVRAVLAELDGVDTRNLFMYGESRGGMMTFQAIRDGFPLRAAATFGAFTDLGALLADVPRFAEMAPKIWPDYESNAAAIHERRSAVMWAEKISVPLLIMHGGEDHELSPAQSLALATKLQALGKPYELIIRAGANHVMTQWRQQRDEHAIEWFRKHMVR